MCTLKCAYDFRFSRELRIAFGATCYHFVFPTPGNAQNRLFNAGSLYARQIRISPWMGHESSQLSQAKYPNSTLRFTSSTDEIICSQGATCLWARIGEQNHPWPFTCSSKLAIPTISGSGLDLSIQLRPRSKKWQAKKLPWRHSLHLMMKQVCMLSVVDNLLNYILCYII